MKKGKQKAFLYQLTNAILIIAIVFTGLGFFHDAMRPQSWYHISFLAYYGLALLIFLLALFFHHASLPNIFYRDMEPLIARTAYEYILHVNRNYYSVYLHCLIYMGSFQKAKALMQEWKPNRVRKIYAQYFEGLLAYYDNDAISLQVCIRQLQADLIACNDKQTKRTFAIKAWNRRKFNFQHQLEAKAALLEKDFSTALDVLRLAADSCDSNVEKLAIGYDQGLAYEGLKQYDQAKRCFEKAAAGNRDLYFVKQAKKRL